MDIGGYSVKNRVVSWLLIIVLVGGGILGFDEMGKLEDPNFTIKEAKIITTYPGATAQQTQEEVTYHIEDAVQKLPQLKRIKMSISRPGYSDIQIQFKDEYTTEQFPNIYDELRRKIADVRHELPPGVGEPVIVDDFADVYGIYLAISGMGYTYRDLKDVAETLQRQLVLVPGVRKIVIGGAQQEVVYIEISRARLGELGLSAERISELLSSQNIVADAGSVRVGDEYIRISPTGEFNSVAVISGLLISSEDEGADKKAVYLGDIATITRAYEEQPSKMVYFNGLPSLTLGISMLPGQNVVNTGKAINEKFEELVDTIPIGIQGHIIYNQPEAVDQSVSGFIVNVGEAIVIVIVVLLLFMGLRTGLIIGAVLLITVAGTLWFMQLFNIELQRVSLGALVIALGMLVDNAIVIAEGMLIRIKAGMKAAKAASEVVSSNAMALLGGTVIGILAFSAIGLSQTSTGEFARSLFYVILISLSLSWITAVSTTPLLCALFLRPDKKTEESEEKDPYAGRVYMSYRSVLETAIRFRWVTVSAAFSLFLAALVGFGYVPQAFFPNSNTPMFFVDIWEVEGTDIRKTRDDTLKVAEFVRNQAGVTQTTSLIGGGDARFSLVYEPKENSPAYAQIIVQTETRDQIPDVWAATQKFMFEEMPQLDPIIKPLRIGPGRDGKIEARFHGTDPVLLRNLAGEAMRIMRADEDSKDVRTDWRQPQKLIKPIFNEQVARQLGINRQDLSVALAQAFEGSQVGIYRDGTRLLPIVVRPPEAERKDVSHIRDVEVWSPILQRSVPVQQVVNRFDTVWEETVIRGRNRMQTIIASANPKGELATPLFNRIKGDVEAIELPPGYSFSWGGEYEDSAEAQAGIYGALPAGFALMIVTSILLFGSVRQPLIIWLTVPLAIIGITAGLLAMNGSFDFMSLLGALSLIGLLIKNAIVLIEEIDQQAETKDLYLAIVDSCVSRMRPVAMAAATTVLGLIPLLQDAFFVNMAMTIMGGLSFATVLTLIVVPVLYAILFNVKNPGQEKPHLAGASI
ncbi:Cobalt-zinc-cadmium resistance protein CzcA [Pseudovibrio sp. W64]|uniref:efflux RND transporter permease subunit n=1 Tax=Pseudovibrio sp. W64 TaxID=1735583 RepID=UPI0007AE60F9|nr:efflux RND transporter permease subunit [Pseudovibrio sp. W64]KZK86303.1 Cobalt-zinc-cadmium resistance protein CzcA [Pseudovibrio sp. W64]